MTDPIVLDHVLAGIVVVFVIFGAVNTPRILAKHELDTATKVSIYWTNGVVMWLLTVATGAVWLLGDRPLATLGLTWQHASIGAGAALTAAFLAWLTLVGWREAGTEARRSALIARWRRHAPFLPETSREFGHFTFVAFTAGVTEEIIFRGFAVLYVASFTGTTAAGLAVAVLLPAVLFSVVHSYHSRRDMVRVFLLAISFGAIFVVTKSLVIPIVLHILIDVVGGALACRLAQTHDAQPSPYAA
ncbi:MAG: CPBP family intramembrane glutamic endopeptidase [Planctomycetota bacterium]|jgi:membrane protease YdiL (CAAX protease family)